MRKHYTAIHEAGHAVAHLRRNIDLGYATIKPDEESRGRISAESQEVFFLLTPEEASDHVIVACAGCAALVAAGVSDAEVLAGADQDMAEAHDLIGYWALPESLEQSKQQSVEFMRRPENVRAVSFVAKALEEHEALPGDVIEQVVDFADDGCTKDELDRFLNEQHPNLTMTCFDVHPEVVTRK